MRPHERLDVWTKGIEFVVSVYKETEVFPKDERFGLTSQLRRAAITGLSRHLRLKSGKP